MKILAMFLTLAAVAVAAVAQDSPGTSAPNTTPAGAVVIINGKTITLKPGETPKLNQGDKVSVVSGDVKFVLPGGDIVNASGAGAAFNVSPDSSWDIKVNYTGGNVSVSDSFGHTDSLSSTNASVIAGVSYGAPGINQYFIAVTVENVQQNTKNQAVSGSTP